MKTLLSLMLVFYSSMGISQENWDYLPIEITNNYHGAIYPIDENTVHVVSDNGKFYKTTDGGETWNQFDSEVNEFFFDLTFDGTDQGYAVGDNGKILKTSNAGLSWTELSSGTTEALISVSINSENSIWVVGNNGTILHSTNGGTSWVLESSLTIEKLNSIKFKNENIGYIAGNNGILFYTENGGNDWEQLTIPTTNDLFSISITETTFYLADGDSYFLDGQLYRFAYTVYKTNNNIDWISYPLVFESPGPSDVFFYSDNMGFTIDSAALLCDCCFVWINKTIDGGEIWNYSLNEETNAANCHANSGYAKINFPTENVGFVLLGRFILKTPYDTASIKDFNKKNVFTIYPNPTANSKFNLEFTTSKLEGFSIEISDINGRKLFTQINLKENNSISIPNISEGIYFVKLLKNGKMVASRKLIKQ